MKDIVSYSINYIFAHRLLINVEFISSKENPELSLATWIPGSYTRRDYARHISNISLLNQKDNQKISIVSAHKWKIQAQAGEKINIQYEIYAHELSVRSCYVDDKRIILNPCACCLMIEGAENNRHQLDLSKLNFKFFGAKGQNNIFQFENYQQMIDSPLLGDNKAISAKFLVQDIEHEIILSSSTLDNVPQYFLQDISKICQAQVNIFGKMPAQCDAYSFLCVLTENSYGGLEHQKSSLLMESRDSINAIKCNNSKYIQLLGLFSHEYFHIWNVKSMRPKIFADTYNLDSEQYFDLLWLFEGFTAYFDNLALFTSGVIKQEQYLNLLSEDISFYLQRYGCKQQTLADASIQAWTTGYNGGENAQNTGTSYYRHGALAAWTMDAFLYKNTNKRLSDLLQLLYKNSQSTNNSISEEDFILAAKEFLKPEQHNSFIQLFNKLIHTNETIDLSQNAEIFGLKLNLSPVTAKQQHPNMPDLACKTDPGFSLTTNNKIRISNPNAPAFACGLASGDEIISINNKIVNLNNLYKYLYNDAPENIVHIQICRDGLIHNYQFPLLPANSTNASLIPK